MTKKNWPMHLLMGAALALTTGLVGGCSGGLQGLSQIDSPSAQSELLLDSGDKLRIVVQDMPNWNTEYLVNDSGAVSLPLIKQVFVRGKTLRQAEQAIEQALADQKILLNPRVSIEPMELRPLYVMGEVNKPGEYTYRPGMTVFSAVSVAGGYTYRAVNDKVEITRMVNGQPVKAMGNNETPVLPGDRIRVAERWF